MELRSSHRSNPGNIRPVHADCRTAWLVTALTSLLFVPLAMAQGQTPDSPRLVVQTSHTGLVTDFVYNADASLLGTLGGDGVAKIWNARTGKEIHTIAGYRLLNIAFHPTDDTLAAIDSDGVISFFDGVSGDRTSILNESGRRSGRKNDNGGIFGQRIPLVFSSDGTLLVTSSDSDLRVWNVQSGQIQNKLGRKVQTDTVSISPDGNVVAAVVDDNFVRMFSTTTGKKIQDISGKVARVNTIEFSVDSKSIAIGSDAGTIRIFDRESGEEIVEPPVYSVCDKPYEIIKKPRGGMKLLGALAKTVAPEVIRDAINIGETAVAIGEVASQACNTANEVRSLSNGIFRRQLGRGIRGIALGASNSVLAYQTNDDVVRVVDTSAGSTLYEIDPDGEFKPWVPPGTSEEDEEKLAGQWKFLSVFNSGQPPVIFSSDGETLNTIANFKTISRWDARSGEKLQSLAVSNRDLSMGFPFPMPRGSVPVFSDDGTALLTASLTAGTKRWDLRNGSPPELISELPALFNDPPVSNNGRLVVTSEINESSEGLTILVKEVGSERVVQRFEYESAAEDSPFGLQFLATFDPKGEKIALQTDDNSRIRFQIFDIQTGDELFKDREILHVSFSPDAKLVALRQRNNDLKVVDTESWRTTFKSRASEPINGLFGGRPQFSKDARLLAAVDGDTINVWDLGSRKLYRKRSVKEVDVSNLVFAPDREVLTYTTNRSLNHWHLAEDEVQLSSLQTDFWGNLSYEPNGRLLALGGAGNRIRLFDVVEDVEIGSLVTPTKGDWLMVTPDGRLDARWLEDIDEVHWVLSEDPYTAQPIELFMREYYEPRLLTKLVQREQLPPLPALAGRNRSLPKVRISDISTISSSRVRVSVEIEETRSDTQFDLEGVPLRSGASGLRVLRNGRLVGYAPDDLGPLSLGADGSASVSFEVDVPRANDKGSVEFSAYAFNRDGVKGPTASRSHRLAPSNAAEVSRTAYVIGIGVNRSEDSSFSLRYAANDARLVLEALSSRLLQTGLYDQVIDVPLISDEQGMHASTDNIRNVLALLSGEVSNAPDGSLNDIRNVSKLRKATPDDLIIVSYAGHGYTEPGGVFYFVPSDIGDESDGTLNSIRHRMISSDVMSLWLRDIDAGELVMIIDACYSASLVEGQQFKPGPLGSKGLGQLSYDKGMRILTATQSNDVALEVASLEHGLLTYALVADGLQRRKADFRPVDLRVTTPEWLRYAVDRVPELYSEARTGAINAFEDGTPVSADRGLVLFREVVAERQRPAVFDFSREASGLLLAGFE